MKRVTNKEEEYKRTRLQIALGSERIGVYTHAITAEFREHAANDPDTLWECEALENTLAYLRLSLGLASSDTTLERFVHDPEAAFYLDESDRIAEQLDEQLIDLVGLPGDKDISKLPTDSPLVHHEIIRCFLDRVNTEVGKLTRVTKQTYDWEGEWPENTAEARKMLVRHVRGLALSTFATTRHLRGIRELHPETLAICESLERNLRGILIAANVSTWFRNAFAVTGEKRSHQDLDVMFDLFAVPFIKAYLALMNGPDVAWLTTMPKSSSRDYYAIPRHLLSLARLVTVLIRSTSRKVVFDLPEELWQEIAENTMEPLDIRECYTQAMTGCDGKEAAK